jgi:malonyl-CoA/methylmalonyl-CoA synthetase
MAAALQRSAFFEAIRQHDPSSTAVVNNDSGVAFSYGSLLRDVSRAKERLLQETGKNESGIAGERIAFMVENGYDYVGAHSSLGNHPNASLFRLQKLSLSL